MKNEYTLDELMNPKKYEPFPSRKEEKCITTIFFLIDGHPAQKRYTGKLLKSEFKEFSLREWSADSIVITKVRYYKVESEITKQIVIR